MTREQIVALGRDGTPWEFVPIGSQVVRVAPDDAGVRFLLASALARVGLRTMASEHLQRLPPQVSEMPQVRALLQQLTTMPSDKIPVATLERRVTQACAVLADRSIAVEGVEDWLGACDRWEWFVAADGNVVARSTDDPTSTRWLSDSRGAAAGFAALHFGAASGARPGPITIEGACPPWMLKSIYESTRATADAYQPLIQIVQRDSAELLTGLAMCNLTELLSDDRVLVFVGDDAGDQLEAFVSSRLELNAFGPVIPLDSTVTFVEPRIEARLGVLREGQQARYASVRQRVEAMYANRGAASWSERFDSLSDPTKPRLRVLIPTCRHSTFIRHASDDLRRSFERAGHEARLLIEPDCQSTLSGVAYMEAIAEFEPDLIVLINYPRHLQRSGFPDNVPFVCWIQDAMPHLFDRELGRAQGDLDFVVGHCFEPLFRDYGYARARSLRMPLGADPVKFRADPIDSTERARFECDVAYVSHQSETPDELHQRLVDEASDARATRALEQLRPRVHDAMGRMTSHSLSRTLLDAATAVCHQQFGADADDQIITRVHRQYGLPMAERLIRHQTIEWAAAFCRRSGRRLKLFGRGWDQHPTLSEFACGALEHGEDLRASYQSAGVHLHASASIAVHQRVVECALSGGLPFVRLHRDICSFRDQVERALESGRIAHCSGPDSDGVQRVAPRDALEEARIRFDVEPSWRVPVDPDRTTRRSAWDRLGLEGLLDGCTECSFIDQSEFDAHLERCLDADWRSSVSAMLAERLRSTLTHDVFVDELISLVSSGLRSSIDPSLERSA